MSLTSTILTWIKLNPNGLVTEGVFVMTEDSALWWPYSRNPPFCHYQSWKGPTFPSTDFLSCFLIYLGLPLKFLAAMNAFNYLSPQCRIFLQKSRCTTYFYHQRRIWSFSLKQFFKKFFILWLEIEISCARLTFLISNNKLELRVGETLSQWTTITCAAR